MGFSNMMIAAAKSIPKSTMTQSMPSLTYSSCSTTNMWWLKNCCSFSFTKLMEICSNPLYSKISKPAMSKTAEVCLLQRGVNESIITLLNQPLEDTVKDSTSNTTSGSSCLLNILSLCDPLGSDLDSGLTESFDHGNSIYAKGCCCFSWKCVRSYFLQFSLLISTLLDVLNSTTSHNTSSENVTVKLFPWFKAKNVECVFCVFQFFIVINGGNSGLSLGHIYIVVDIVTDKTFCPKTTITDPITIGHQKLVKYMVGTFNFLLFCDTGLFQQVGHNVTTSKFARASEMDTDKFTKARGIIIPGSFSITIRFQNGIGCHNLVLKRYFLFTFLSRSSSNHGQISDDFLGVLCFTCTRLTSNQHSIVLLVL